jgi:hypothetical protein
MSQTHTVSIGYQLAIAGASGDRKLVDKFEHVSGREFADSTGAQAANQGYTTGEKTLGGSPDSYDLNGGGLANGAGGGFSITKIKTLIVTTPSANAGDVTIGGGTNALAAIWSANLVLPPGSRIALDCSGANGWQLTAGTADTLRVSGTSGDKYTLAITGE